MSFTLLLVIAYAAVSVLAAVLFLMGRRALALTCLAVMIAGIVALVALLSMSEM